MKPLLVLLMLLLGAIPLAACGLTDDALATAPPAPASPASVPPSPSTASASPSFSAASAAGPSASPANASPSPAASEPIAAEPAEPEPPITINLVGDILLDSTVGSNIKKYGADYPFAKTADLLADADITFGNLETSVSTRGKAQDKQFTFRSRPETLQGLVDAGFDGVTVANNHAMDFGATALLDTIANLDNYKLGHTGAGSDEEEAFRPYVQEVRGKKVAILGISRVLPNGSWYAGKNKIGIAQGYTMEPMISYIKKTASEADYTIVYMHWNKETMDYPEDYARSYAKAFIDAGADAVVGAHSHCLQGIEWYKGKPVFYSLGNFIFTSKSEKSSQTMILKLSLDGDEVVARVTPAKIVNTQAQLKDDKYNQSIYAKLNRISFNATVDQDGMVEEKR